MDSWSECQMYEKSFEQIVEELNQNPHNYEIGATYDMYARNPQHYPPLFTKIFFASVNNVQECEKILLSILPTNHPYIQKQNGGYPWPGEGFVYIVSRI